MAFHYFNLSTEETSKMQHESYLVVKEICSATGRPWIPKQEIQMHTRLKRQLNNAIAYAKARAERERRAKYPLYYQWKDEGMQGGTQQKPQRKTSRRKFQNRFGTKLNIPMEMAAK